MEKTQGSGGNSVVQKANKIKIAISATRTAVAF